MAGYRNFMVRWVVFMLYVEKVCILIIAQRLLIPIVAFHDFL
jgi:hypothetical protein